MRVNISVDVIELSWFEETIRRILFFKPHPISANKNS
jgi:hypothetical protein